MTTNRNWVLLGLTIVALVAISGTISSMTLPTDVFTLILFTVLGELVVYFIAMMVTNPRATIPMAAGSAVVLVIIRALCGAVGGVAASLIDASPAESVNPLTGWLHPIATVIQGVTMLIAGPFLLATILPDLVGSDQVEKLLGTPKKVTSGMDSNPTGGFVQVFSFEELGAQIKKCHGLEGFVIYSNEGLVVWRDLPMRIDLDVLTAQVLKHSMGLGALFSDSGLTKVRRVMVESREHFLFATTLNQNFGLILLFSGRVAPEEILARIAVLAKTTREFLQYKYPALPLAAGMTKEKLTLETV